MKEVLSRHRDVLLVVACALLMALSFQGSRGLWDPDEGRYSNVALQMIDSDDYLTPRRNDDALHVTKPPLTYWTMVASVQAFGRSEWSLRLPMALAFALTAGLVFSLGRAFVPQRPWLPALIYVSSPLPFLAASAVTTDTLLTLGETLAVLAYAQFRFLHRSPRWLDVMWAAFGLAFMIKGPPALLPLLAIVAWEIQHRQWRTLVRPIGLMLFAAIGLSWFVWIVSEHRELLSYFLGHELVGRIASAEHDRHAEWYGAFVIYLPTLAIGALPWAAIAVWRRWLQPAPRALPTSARFLWLWLLLPLTVFFLARSRLPFYLLPLFVPISLLVGQALADLPMKWGRISLAAAWLGVMLAVKALIAQAPSGQDARHLAKQLRPLFPTPAQELVFVETKARYGLRYYLDAEVERISLDQADRQNDAAVDDDLTHELAEHEPGVYFLVPADKVEDFRRSVQQRRFAVNSLGALKDLHVFTVAPNP